MCFIDGQPTKVDHQFYITVIQNENIIADS